MTISEMSKSLDDAKHGNDYCFAMHERFDREDALVGYVGVSGAASSNEAFHAVQRLYPGYCVGKRVGGAQ